MASGPPKLGGQDLAPISRRVDRIGFGRSEGDESAGGAGGESQRCLRSDKMTPRSSVRRSRMRGRATSIQMTAAHRRFLEERGVRFHRGGWASAE